MKKKPTIGFVGLGIMGMAMARNTLSKGFSVVTTTRSNMKRNDARENGLIVVDAPVDVANQSDAIVVMVSDPSAVQNVLGGKNGILEGEIRGKTLIQMSTIDENSTHSFAKEAESRGLSFLDCPVAGSKKQVEKAELIILAGGDQSLLKIWNSPLLAMGKTIVYAGPIGKGTALKLCMNLIVAQMTTGLCESVALAKAQGVNPERIFDVLRDSPALNCGYFQIKENALLNQDFTPAFSLENMLKDVRFMDQTAKTLRLPLPVTQAVRFLMEGALEDGLGQHDLSSIVKVLAPKINQN